LLDEKQKKEEEMLFVQGNYDSLQQEVESMREIMEKLRDKYKKSQAEIKDIKGE
jgi:peptidoglycan hydrolase CwlO-like protein